MIGLSVIKSEKPVRKTGLDAADFTIYTLSSHPQYSVYDGDVQPYFVNFSIKSGYMFLCAKIMQLFGCPSFMLLKGTSMELQMIKLKSLTPVHSEDAL